MKFRVAIPLACLALLPSCKEKSDVVIKETRSRVAQDASPKLFASSDERFRNARPSPVKGETPETWQVQPATDLRLLNYRFGQSGEVWVSISSGGVLDNVNRWISKQFGAPAIDPAGLEILRKVPVAGISGVWVEAAGDYTPGMGTSPKTGYGLAGVIAEVGGRILTVKMIGPQAEVDAEKANLEDYAAKLVIVD